MKTQFAEAVKPGDNVDDVFVLAEKNMGRKKDGAAYLNVVLTDRTGSLKGVVWDHVDQIAAENNAGDFVRVRAGASEYRGALQLVVKAMTPCALDSVDPGDFLPRTSRNIDQMFERLQKLADAMTHPHLKALMAAFFTDEAFVAAFKRAPAAKNMHHAYIGGLLEHTLSLALLVERVAGHYGGVDMDLVLTGAMLHDIGKTREFDYATKIDYSHEGRLMSHIIIGLDLLNAKLAQLPDFPADLAILVRHMIVSHHGTKEFGSPEPPKTLEAVLLHYLDEVDSKLHGIREFMNGEDPGEEWTGFHRVFGRHFYKGPHVHHA